jgi:hypothetical protein
MGYAVVQTRKLAGEVPLCEADQRHSKLKRGATAAAVADALSTARARGDGRAEGRGPPLGGRGL